MATQTLDEKGNVVVDGMNTNVTPSQFQAISTNAFTPTKPLSIPQPQPQDVSGIVGQEIANIGALQAKYDTANTQASDIYSQLAGLSTQNKEADLATAYQTGGVNDAASKIRQLNAQAQALNLEAQAVPLQVQQESIGRGRTEAGIAPLQTARLRENALKALSLGQQAALAQADYQTAKDKADQMITIKYADIENQINTKKLQLDALDRFVLTPTQERLKEARALALKKEERDIAEKKANEKAVSDLMVNASSQNAPQDILNKAKNAKTPAEAAMALGSYAGDYWGTKIKIAQYNKILSETNKIDTQTSGLKLQPTGVVTTPNGDAVSLPNETLGAIGKLKLTEGQSNAVAFVSRMIQSDSAIKKQLGAISPTGGFYETSGYDPTSLGSSIGRTVGSDNSRIYNTNAQDFIRAKLRKESGATITPDEFNADAAIYTPSGAGLDQRDLLLAETKREEAIKSMIAQAGPAAPYLQQYFEQTKTKGYEYDPYLDEQVIPSISGTNTTSSSAYASSLLGK